MNSLATTVSRKASALIPKAEAHELNAFLLKSKRIAASLDSASSAVKAAAKSASEWTRLQGDDLADIGDKSADLSSLVARALEEYADQQEEARCTIKEIRDAEEALDLLQKERKSTATEIDRAVKKNKPTVDLRARLSILDRQLEDSRASLYTLKRRVYARSTSLSFDSLAVLSAQLAHIACAGQSLSALVPQAPLYAGESLPKYTGHASTSQLVSEAGAKASGVTLNSVRLPSNDTTATSSASSSPKSRRSGHHRSVGLNSPPLSSSPANSPPLSSSPARSVSSKSQIQVFATTVSGGERVRHSFYSGNYHGDIDDEDFMGEVDADRPLYSSGFGVSNN